MIRTNIFAVAWDKPFIDKFAEYAIPCLLSQNNLPELAKSRPLRFLLYTNRASHDYFLERTRSLEALGDRCVYLFEDTIIDSRTIADHASEFIGSTYKHEIERNSQFHAIDQTVESGGSEILFMIPNDLVITNGSFSYAQTKMDEGADAVLIPMLRLSFEGSTEILKLLAVGNLKTKDFCQNLAAILHPISQRSFADSNEFIRYPSTIIWPNGNSRWLARSFFPHTFALRPRMNCRRFDSTIDYDYALNLAAKPERIIIPKHSDEAFTAKVTTETYLKIEPEPNRLQRNTLAHFILAETNQAHRQLVDKPYQIIGDEFFDPNSPNWMEAKSLSMNTLNEVYAFLDVLRDQLPKDSIQARMAIRSHFGNLSEYLSPMRRS
jgi:hypothetical protein